MIRNCSVPMFLGHSTSRRCSLVDEHVAYLPAVQRELDELRGDGGRTRRGAAGGAARRPAGGRRPAVAAHAAPGASGTWRQCSASGSSHSVLRRPSSPRCARWRRSGRPGHRARGRAAHYVHAATRRTRPGTKLGTATDPDTGARMTVKVVPAAGWVRVNAAVAGIPRGREVPRLRRGPDGSRAGGG